MVAFSKVVKSELALLFSYGFTLWILRLIGFAIYFYLESGHHDAPETEKERGMKNISYMLFPPGPFSFIFTQIGFLIILVVAALYGQNTGAYTVWNSFIAALTAFLSANILIFIFVIFLGIYAALAKIPIVGFIFYLIKEYIFSVGHFAGTWTTYNIIVTFVKLIMVPFGAARLI